MIFHLMSTEQPECQVFFFFNGTGRYHNEQTLLKATPDPGDMKKKVSILEGNSFGRTSQ